jgi:hypothetical protein
VYWSTSFTYHYKLHLNSTNSCSCEEDIENLKSTVLDLQCRSMKNNLIFTGLHEVSNEYTEDLLRDVLYSELGIDYKIEFGNVHCFGRNAWDGYNWASIPSVTTKAMYITEFNFVVYSQFTI